MMFEITPSGNRYRFEIIPNKLLDFENLKTSASLIIDASIDHFLCALEFNIWNTCTSSDHIQ